MARLRAVVVIQPPGLGGRPSPGHLRRATANASCTASSATSMSPKIADQGGHRSAGLLAEDPADLGRVEPAVRASTSRSRQASGIVPERADLDRAADRRGGLRRPDERGVEILGLDDVEAAQVFLRLREGPVGGQHLAVGHRVRPWRCRARAERCRRRPRRPPTSSPPRGCGSAPGLLHLLFGHRGAALDAVGRQQVLGHRTSSSRAGLPAAHPTTNGPRPYLTPGHEENGSTSHRLTRSERRWC